MKPFTQHRGIAAPLLRINIDTDAIIPSREMKTVTKRGLSGGLFAGWRYESSESRKPNPDFVLNQAPYAGTSIILSGDNFGCGSSREHAVWALAEYGIRSIIAPSFGAIFYNNCVRNGLLPIVLDDATVKVLAKQVEPRPQTALISIDLQQCEITGPEGESYPFKLESGHRSMLLEGLDPIGVTLKHEQAITTHLEQDKQQRPWAYICA